MNLVEIATWIQEGYQDFYALRKNNSKIHPISTCKGHVLRHVMLKGRGNLNPTVISTLIDMETSVPDENGMVQC